MKLRGLSDGESTKWHYTSIRRWPAVEIYIESFSWIASQSLFLEAADVANNIDLAKCATQPRNPTARSYYTQVWIDSDFHAFMLSYLVIGNLHIQIKVLGFRQEYMQQHCCIVNKMYCTIVHTMYIIYKH